MKKAYLECLKKLRTFRKSLFEDIDKKRGKMYFTWLKDKTEKVMNEKDENYIYTNVVKYTFNKSNKVIKNIIKKNYSFKENKYTFNNPKISVDDVKLLMRYVLFKRGNVIWLDFGFNIGNMKKISMLRVNFSGTIGTLDGIDMDAIAEKISIELGNKKTK